MDDWSKLPGEILEEMALKLNCVQDIIYFSVVCNSWHCASLVKMKRAARIPWLMLPQKTEENPDCLRKVFCPDKQISYQLKIPQISEARCWGSSSGWIVALDLNPELFIFNPLTRARVCLPPPRTLPCDPDLVDVDPLWMRMGLVLKTRVVDDSGDLIILLSYDNDYSRIAYARPGDQAWTKIVNDNVKKVSDFVRWGSQILFLGYNGAIGYCDWNSIKNSGTPTVKEYLPSPSEIFNYSLLKWTRMVYLLESFGDLFMVIRYKWEDDEDPVDIQYMTYKTTDFKVYKLNFYSKNWEEVNNLGDIALFVGNNQSFSIGASSVDNCRGNSIYFTDDQYEFWDVPKRKGGHDMGIFDVKTKKFHKVYEDDDIHSNFCTSLWFTPFL